MHDITTPELIALLTPFVGAKLNPPRDTNGYALPRTTAIDIRIPGVAMIDADLRAVTETSFERSFYSGCETFALADISRVTIRGLDHNGNDTAVTEYRHVAKLAEAA